MVGEMIVEVREQYRTDKDACQIFRATRVYITIAQTEYTLTREVDGDTLCISKDAKHGPSLLHVIPHAANAIGLE